jgi:hypothetical protein
MNKTTAKAMLTTTKAMIKYVFIFIRQKLHRLAAIRAGFAFRPTIAAADVSQGIA